MKIAVLSSFGIIINKIVHDLTLYEHEVTIAELRREHPRDNETPEDREERLHTEIAGEQGV